MLGKKLSSIVMMYFEGSLTKSLWFGKRLGLAFGFVAVVFSNDR
jgi:hypothetical protein